LAQARPADFEALAALFEALHNYNAELDDYFALAEGWRAMLYQRFLETYDDNQVLWLLAWHNTRPVGLLILKVHVESALFEHRTWTELVSIYVVPDCRGLRLARQLLDYARAWTAAHGLERLQLYVTASNERARAFYRRCGLRPAQEIWRLDVEPATDMHELPPDATTRETDLLEQDHHYMGGNPPD
jgi:ribosomal protein S18 acetylase RimI-like enzyme